jgi:ribonuclease-3
VDRADFEHAQTILKHEFGDPELLHRAFRHASVTENRLESNERLEFLGDAILGMIVCERIFRRYPEYLEGEMTKIKSLTVSRATCSSLAQDVGLDVLIKVGKGMQTQDKLPGSLSAAVTESVIAALYLDGGIDAVRRFLEPLIDPMIDDAVKSGHQHNFKSVLQQHAQRVLGSSPCYEILDEQGPDHDKSFKVRAVIGGDQYDAAWGPSKKQAEQLAALNALTTMGVVEHNGDGEPLMVSGSGDDASVP